MILGYPFWIVWAVFGLLLLGTELLTGTLFLLCFGCAALLTAVLSSLLPGSVLIPWLFFLIASAVAVHFLKRADRNSEDARPSNIDRLINSQGRIVKVQSDGLLRVEAQQEEWQAELQDRSSQAEAGMAVKILQIRGATLIVDLL